MEGGRGVDGVVVKASSLLSLLPGLIVSYSSQSEVHNFDNVEIAISIQSLQSTMPRVQGEGLIYRG